MELNNKSIGVLLSIMGGVGAIASIAIMFPLQGACPLVMEFYHQILLVMMPVFIILLALGLYLYFKKEEIKLRTIIKSTKIEKILTPDERRVIEFLKGKKSVTQSEIRKGLDMPRATLSVLLARMQKRKLVKKERIGKTNYVIPMKGF
jgi:uncharacterized membrane protein